MRTLGKGGGGDGSVGCFVTSVSTKDDVNTFSSHTSLNVDSHVDNNVCEGKDEKKKEEKDGENKREEDGKKEKEDDDKI
jgi:hypothetical protein